MWKLYSTTSHVSVAAREVPKANLIFLAKLETLHKPFIYVVCPEKTYKKIRTAC